MEELLELKTYVEQKDYASALNLIGEMEEMSRDDKINKVRSFAIVLLIHLIKQAAEGRTTRSWEASIFHAIDSIQSANKRRKAGGFYLNMDDLLEVIDESFATALKRAALEAFEGQFSDDELAGKIDVNKIKGQALQLIHESM